MRYYLRTLLIVLAILPPLLWFGWTKYEAWRAAERQRAELERMHLEHDRLDLGMLPTVLKDLKDLKHTEKANNVPKDFWPGMWLSNRAGHSQLHIFSDGTPESGVPGLIGCLDDVDPGIRESAAGWLGAIGPRAKDALPALQSALQDNDELVRAAAADAIQRIESVPLNTP